MRGLWLGPVAFAVTVAILVGWCGVPWLQREARADARDAVCELALAVKEAAEFQQDTAKLHRNAAARGDIPVAEALAHLARALDLNLGVSGRQELAEALLPGEPRTVTMDSFTSARCSRDGRRVLVRRYADRASLWDVGEGRELARLEGHSGWSDSESFSPPGFLFRHVRRRRPLYLRHVPGGRSQLVRYPEELKACQRRSTDVNQALVSGVGARLEILATLNGHVSREGLVSFSVDGRLVKLTTWEEENWRLDFMAASRESVWDRKSGQLLAESGPSAFPWEGEPLDRSFREDPVLADGFSELGPVLLTAGWDGSVQVWNVDSGQKLSQLVGHRAEVLAADIAAGGRHVLSVSEDGSARVWDLPRGRELVKIEGLPTKVRSVRFSPDGGRALTVFRDSARVWDVASGALLARFEGEAEVRGARFGPAGRRLLVEFSDGMSRLFDLFSGQELGRHGPKADMRADRLGTDPCRVLTTGAGTASLWDVCRRTVVAKLARRDHRPWPASTRLSQDRQWVLTGYRDALRLWSVKTDEELSAREPSTGSPPDELCASADGGRVLTVSGSTVRAWPLLKSTAPAPDWFPDLLRLAAKRYFDDEGKLQYMSIGQVQDLEPAVRKAVSDGLQDETEAPYARLGRWFFGGPLP